MSAQARKSLSYLAAFLLSAGLLFSSLNLPNLVLVIAIVCSALLWGATLLLARQGLAPLRAPLKAVICSVLLIVTIIFLIPAGGDANGWTATLRFSLIHGDLWLLMPFTTFAGFCLLSLDKTTLPKGRVVSSLPDLAFGLAAMIQFYLALRLFPNLPKDLPALWGHTSVHYLILWTFFYVASYIARCFLAIWRFQEGRNANQPARIQGERSLRRFMRVVIGTLPLLGFLGTVLGITQALSGLPALVEGGGALEQNTSAALGSGLASIAIAFETTMLGLITSLIATVSLSYAEKLESDLEWIVDPTQAGS